MNEKNKTPYTVPRFTVPQITVRRINVSRFADLSMIKEKIEKLQY